MSLRNTLNKAKSIASVVKDKLTQSEYRTSTLNDFSTIEKATLRFASTVDCKPTPPIPVQINPSEISYNYESYATEPNIVSNIQGDSRVLEVSKDPFLKSKMTFTLYYDFYDEYYARSANGSGFSLNMLSGKGGFCLTNPTYSSLQTIIDKSCDVSNYVLFKWGQLEHFGQIETVDPHYTAFSPYGEPLKANASIEMRIYFNENEQIPTDSRLYKVYTALIGDHLPYGGDTFKNKVSDKLNKGGKLLRNIYPTIKALR